MANHRILGKTFLDTANDDVDLADVHDLNMLALFQKYMECRKHWKEKSLLRGCDAVSMKTEIEVFTLFAGSTPRGVFISAQLLL